MKPRDTRVFDVITNPDVRSCLQAFQAVDIAVDDCLAINPAVEPEIAAAYLGQLLGVVYEQMPNLALQKGERPSIMEQTLEAFGWRWYKDPLEIFENPKEFFERNRRLDMYTEAAHILLSNTETNPNNNPIITALDS